MNFGNAQANAGLVEWKMPKDENGNVIKLTGVKNALVQASILFLAWRQSLMYGLLGFALLTVGIVRTEDCPHTQEAFSCAVCNATYYDIDTKLPVTNLNTDIVAVMGVYDVGKCMRATTSIHNAIKGVLITFCVLLCISFTVEIVFAAIDPTGGHAAAQVVGRVGWSRWRRMLITIISIGGQVLLVGTLVSLSYYMLREAEQDQDTKESKHSLEAFSVIAYLFFVLYIIMFLWTAYEIKAHHGVVSKPDTSMLVQISEALPHMEAGNMCGTEKHNYMELLHWLMYICLFGTMASIAHTASTVVDDPYPTDDFAVIQGHHPTAFTWKVSSVATNILEHIDPRRPITITYSGTSTLLHTLKEHRYDGAVLALTFAWLSFIVNVVVVVILSVFRWRDLSIAKWNETWRSTRFAAFADSPLVETLMYLSWVAGSFALNLFLLGMIYIVMRGWNPHDEAAGVGSIVVGIFVLLGATTNFITMCACLGGKMSSTDWSKYSSMGVVSSRAGTVVMEHVDGVYRKVDATKMVALVPSKTTQGGSHLRSRAV